jgi:NACalpha-BTF3-like transcription factor
MSDDHNQFQKLEEPPNSTNTVVESEKRKWIGLTDEDIYTIAKQIGHSYFSMARAIEAKLKEKNYD